MQWASSFTESSTLHLAPHTRSRQGKAEPFQACACCGAYEFQFECQYANLRFLYHTSQTQKYSRVHGWTLARHAWHPTTDIPVAAIPSVARWMHQQLRDAILPTVAHLYDFQQSELTVCDLFVVRYTASSGSGKDQSKLPAHRDGNLLSFNILLSDPSTEFKGGGTHFFSLRKATVYTQQHAEHTDNPDDLDSSNSVELQQQQYDYAQQSKQPEHSYGVTVQPQQGEVTFHTECFHVQPSLYVCSCNNMEATIYDNMQAQQTTAWTQ
eukprot:6726-Heterococcus_DN1.PRE.3